MSRKDIVQALEAKWGVKAKYLGAPTFAYEVGGYRVDRSGAVTSKDNLDDEIPNFEELQMTEGEELGLGKKRREDFQGENGMRADDCPRAEKSEAAYPACTFPLDEFTAAMLRNLVNMLASKEHLITAAFELERPMLDEQLAEEIEGREIGDVDSFVAVWDELEQGRAPGMKLNAATRTFLLDLPKQAPTGEELEAFGDLMVLMVNFAKSIKSASRKTAQTENPRYAMRTWLIRLGMNGDEFKAARKVLLAKLVGNSAFRRDPGLRDFLDAYHGGANSGGAEGGV
jgi:hypothetical protein